MKTFCIIGSGNVATHIAKGLFSGGYQCLKVCSRTLKNAEELAQRIGSTATTDLNQIPFKADLYIISISDNAVTSVAKELIPKISQQSTIVHTAGSIGIDILKASTNSGVFYPLQTFTKERELDMSKVPIFIEFTTPAAHKEILDATKALNSEQVIECNSTKRRQIHLAAVFACNFVNNMYHSASHLLESNHLPQDALSALIRETYLKAVERGASKSQTGPAVRNDSKVMDKHIELLKEAGETSLINVYKAVSENIIELNNKK